MTEIYILAIDQGTTNSKAFLINAYGQIKKEATRVVEINYPQPGWVEQDAINLWKTCLEAIAEVLQDEETAKIIAVAVTNQRETTLIWERETGKPLGPAVVWQCRRSAPFCTRLRERGLEEKIYQSTGLTVDPMFSAGKARWLLDSLPGAQKRALAGELCLGTVDSWILWNLTGGKVHACDVTNASRTQLFNLQSLSWDTELLDIYGIPRQTMPEVKLSSAIYGSTLANGVLPGGIPIGALIGDSHAALFGHAGFYPGCIKATYGTGSSLMTPTITPIFSQYGLSTSLAWGFKEVTYALEGNIYVTGSAVQWLEQVCGLHGPEQVESLAQQVEGSEGVYFVPALVGLGAPYWKENASGLLTGLRRGTTMAHLARATIESIAYQIKDVFEAMQIEAGTPLKVLLADGGATRNNLLMQFQADMLDVPVLRSLVSDSSALGAAYLAGLAVGVWESKDQIATLVRPHDEFTPWMEPGEREKLYAGWKEAVKRTIL